MRYLMTLSYDGTNYHGYQRQPKTKTIEGEVEKILYRLNGNCEIIIHATGRTDTHVHALNQKAHFDMHTIMTTDQLQKSLNSLLPSDIYVKKIEKVDPHFHARYNLVAKEYIYVMNLKEYNPMERNYVYQYNKDLNIEKMKQAIEYFLGEHNFKSFTKATNVKESYIRTIFSASIVEVNGYIQFKFKGNGFLQYMVRNMVGTVIEVGEGKRLPSDILSILQSHDRKNAGKTAPPEGLYLGQVFY